MILTKITKLQNLRIRNLFKYFIFIAVIFTESLMGHSTLPKYYTKTLENGLEVVAIPLHNSSNVITTDIFYKVGSRNEVMGKSGIAHMLEHMNFKSSKNLKAGEFDQIVKDFGGVDNASTGFDYTNYFIKSSSKNLEKSLELFAELMKNLTLKDKEFQPERNVVEEERRWRTDNSPVGYLQFRLFNNAYIYHPYHWTPIGFMSDIKSWDIQDIKDFHNIYYQPKNAVIVVAGDINEEQVFKYAHKYFKKIKNKEEIPKVHAKEPKQDGAKLVNIKKDSQVQIISIAYHIPNFESKDQVALSALSELLSDGKSSILYKNLVDSKKYVNSVYAYNMELKDPGLFVFLAVCNPNIKAKDVGDEFLKIIEQIKEKGVTQEELDKIKINTRASFIFSLEDSSSVASLFGSYFARGDIKPLLTYEDDIDKLTSKDIVEVINKYLIPSNSTTVILKK